MGDVEGGRTGRGAAGEGVVWGSPAADPEGPYARIAAVALIQAKQDGRWLMLRTTHPSWFARKGRPTAPELWGPPGGRLERGEDLEAALRREVREETGLEVEVAGPVYAYLTVHKGERLLSVSMACRVVDSDQPIRPDGIEVDGFRWVTTAEWLCWAQSGLTPWEPEDVVRVAAMATELWRVVDAGARER